MPTSRLVVLTTSPRVAPGLLSPQAWEALRETAVIRLAPDTPLLAYLEQEHDLRDIVEVDDETDPGRLAESLLAAAQDEADVVWVVGPDGDEALLRRLAEGLEGGAPVVLEVIPGSYDLPGARLLDLVATMDRLRSPGGCPWDAQQTHESLTQYLLEETYETLEAIESGDREHLREELGDLLLQVVFHARIAIEHPDEPWDVDDVAGDIVDKLVRRHPHVFGPATEATTAAAVEANWHTAKAAEKGRTSAMDGVPPQLPALAYAAKVLHRAESHGVRVAPAEDGSVGARLMALAAEASGAGLDPEAELRRAARAYADAVRAAEELA